MSEDFRGPIGQVDLIIPSIQEGGILLGMKVRYPGTTRPEDPPSLEAVLVPLDVARELLDTLSTALSDWVKVYRHGLDIDEE